MILRLGELEELDCSGVREGSFGWASNCMVFPPLSVCSGGLSAVRAFFSSGFVDFDLTKGVVFRPEDDAEFRDALQTVTVKNIDLSDNAELGTSGVARLLECVGSGVKSVNLKGTGLGLAAGPTTQSGFMHSQLPSSSANCSDSDWARLEGALRGLAALDTIDLSDNVSLLTSGVSRLVSCCAGEKSAFVGLLLMFALRL